jgi:hypothetical protein
MERASTSHKVSNSTRHFPQKVTFDDKAIVSDVFRKNLSKLKKQFYKLSEYGVEEKVMNEILDNKNLLLDKIKHSMNKMSK